MTSRMGPVAIVFVGALAAMVLGSAVTADAATFSFERVFGGATGFSASITVTWNDALPSQIKIKAKNTTQTGASVPSAGAPTDCPSSVTLTIDDACRLLTTFGWAATAISQSIIGGSAVIPTGSFGVGKLGSPPAVFNYPAGTDWSGEWGYANNAFPDTLGQFDFLSTNQSHTTAFGGANLDRTVELDGPQGGILSSIFLGNAGGLGFVEDTLEFTVMFGSALVYADFLSLQSAKWFVEFASSGYWLTSNGNGGVVEEVTEPGTLLMLGIGLVALVFAGRVRGFIPVV